MAAMSATANRILNWNVLIVSAEHADTIKKELGASDLAHSRGGKVVALTTPAVVRLRTSFLNVFGYGWVPGWKEVFGLPVDRRIRALRNRDVRERMRRGLAEVQHDPRVKEYLDIGCYQIAETFSATNAALSGRTVGDIATERRQEPLDTLLDVVIADNLKTVLLPRARGDDVASWNLRARIWRDPRVVLGASDAGAHLDMTVAYTYFTELLGDSVRQHKRISLPAAVKLLTDVPARLYGLRGRGRIALGWHADLVVFDPDRIAPGAVVTRYDLPAGAPRLYADAVGIEHVFVNGTEIVTASGYTGNEPGTLLRSGRDTDTVAVS
jgi:N-acyl-D-aspartate/D-glutamate deacylase